MRIHLGANYEGYRKAETLRDELTRSGHEVIWHAAPTFDDDDDYPGISIRTAQAVVADEDRGLEARGILVGGIGAGEVIAANKVNGARAVAGLSPEYVATARAHTDVNTLVLPTAYLTDAAPIIDALLGTPFSGDLEDARRLVNVAEFETSGTIEGWMIET